MKLIRFTCQSELSTLQQTCTEALSLWASRWGSPESSVGLMTASMLNDRSETQPGLSGNWLSGNIGRGKAFIPVSESDLTRLSAFILGIDEANAKAALNNQFVQELLKESCKELLDDLSRCLCGNGVSEIYDHDEPQLSVGNIWCGGYRLSGPVVDIVLDSQALFRMPEVTEQSSLVSRNQALKDDRVEVEAFLPPSKISLNELLNIKKGNILITDTKIGSDVDVYIEHEKVRTGTLGKHNGLLAIKMSRQDK